MRLSSFTVKNFRSITDAYRLPLRDFAVLVGPNNEGKSNILKAIGISLRILSRSRYYVQRRQLRYRYGGDEETLNYIWQRDFPLSLQTNEPNARSQFMLEFELSSPELVEFRTKSGINLASNLKLRLSLGRDDAKVDFLLQGKAKKTTTKKPEELAAFVGDRLVMQYIPAIRPTNLAESVIEDLISSELAQLETNLDYQKILKQLEDSQKPILDALGVELTKTISSFIPEVKGVILKSGLNSRAAINRSATIFIDDGNETELGAKGDGVKSLTAISLIRHLAQRSLSNRSLILAIEEPESHLHPTAVHRLREVLLEIAKDHQVIVSTHSPILVDRHQISRNIIVNAGKALPARSSSDVREALGVQISDNLSSAKLILLVEGEEDKTVLLSWLPALSTKIRSALSNGYFAIDSLNGASNLRYKLGTYRTLVCEVYAFIDNDIAGRLAVQAAINSHMLEQNEFQMVSSLGMANSELEDLILETTYAVEVQNKFGITLVAKFMSHSKKQWSDRVRDNFKQLGKPWTDQIEQTLKTLVATCAASEGLASLNPHRKPLIDELVTQIEKRL